MQRIDVVDPLCITVWPGVLNDDGSGHALTVIFSTRRIIPDELSHDAAVVRLTSADTSMHGVLRGLIASAKRALESLGEEEQT